MSQYQN